MHRRDRLPLALCVLAVTVAVLAIGGATRWSQAAVATITVAAIATVVASRRGFERRPPLVVLLLAASAATLVQLIPLPAGLVHAVTPTLDALRADGAAVAGVSPGSTLSMDPAASLRALTFLLTLSGIAAVALRVSVTESGRYALIAIVALIAGTSAAIAGVHELIGARRLYGIFEPYELPPILGPLLNTNHLGCLSAVGAVTSTGLLLHDKQSTLRRVGWALCGALCVVVTTATYSRGAVVGLAAGIGVTLATLVAQRVTAHEIGGSRRRREKFLVSTFPIGVIVVCGLVVTVYHGAGTVMNQLGNTSLEELHAPRTKFAAWRSSVELIEDSPWVGVGRGAFESAFTRVHPASAYATFSHPENEAVQAVVEWGIPLALVLAALAGWVVLLAVRRWKSGPLAAGALGAVMVVAFQSNFDFGMELLGVAAPVVLVLATLTYGALRELAPGELRTTRAVRVGHGVAILVGGIALATPLTRTLEEDHRDLRHDPSPATILESIEAHPLDYFGFATLAEQRFRANDSDAIRALNHALRLHPTHPGMHWVAARLLVRVGRLEQAEAEYSTTVRYTQRPKPVIDELVTVLPPERAARAIPLDLHVESARWIRYDIAILWLDRMITHTGDARAADTLYTLAQIAKDWATMERALRYRCELNPNTKCTLELAKLLLKVRKAADVIEIVGTAADWQGRKDDQLAGWLMLCEAYAMAERHDDAADCMRRLDASGLKALVQ